MMGDFTSEMPGDIIGIRKPRLPPLGTLESVTRKPSTSFSRDKRIGREVAIPRRYGRALHVRRLRHDRIAL